MALPKPTAAKDETINIRATSGQRNVIDQAAELRGMSRSEFMLDASYREAQNALMDQTFFVLDPEAFDAFRAMLDNPPPPSPELIKLMTHRSPWE